MTSRAAIASRFHVSGFTLVELTLVLTIFGIVSVLAVSGFQGMVKDQQVRNYAFDLYADITLARNEAIKRNCTVSISPVSGNWKSGWTVSTSSSCPSTTVLKTETATGITVTGAPADLYYGKSGRLVSSATSTSQPSSSPSFQISDKDSLATYTRCLTIELSGMPRAAKGTCT